MNRIENLFQTKKRNILSIYFTAGYPELNNTCKIIKELEKSGVEMIEIGMPFSDPVADGEVIQQSSLKALNNGMSVKILFEQLKDIRNKVSIPLILMGYLNPVYQYGIENFCKSCKDVGVDGVIIPDLPFDVYLKEYKIIFDKYDILYIPLITPQTSKERIREIDSNTRGFIYAVSSYSTTGGKLNLLEKSKEYFEKLVSMKLNNPFVIGFGIQDKESFEFATKYANGAIIGSAFVKNLKTDCSIYDFIKQIK